MPEVITPEMLYGALAAVTAAESMSVSPKTWISFKDNEGGERFRHLFTVENGKCVVRPEIIKLIELSKG